MAVAGIDIGNLNNIIAIARKGGVDVILNNESKRETPCSIGFGLKQRFIGTAASGQVSMYPQNTITQVKRFIGRKFNDPDVQRDLQTYPVKVEEGPNGECLFSVQYKGDNRKFTPEQVLAMIMTDLKDIAMNEQGGNLSDFVISCPVFFDNVQREAILTSAKIAGINCLRLVPETTATALGYGLYRDDLSEEPVVVFIDVGHSSFQCSIVEFKKGELKVLAHKWDRNLGGRDFDLVLMNHFAEEFKQKYKMDPRENRRAMVRMQVACEKLKKVLSANSEAPLNIECLMDEIDFRGHLTRDRFEELASSVLARVAKPLEEAIVASGIGNKDKISEVQLVGSASRTPAIVKTIETIFGQGKIMRTLNASECVGRGCALACAMISPVFKVREFSMIDICPYAISVIYPAADGSETFKRQEVFNMDKVPCEKVITFERSKPFEISAIYSNSESPSNESLIAKYKIGPFDIPPNQQKAKLKVHLHLSLHGLFYVGKVVSVFEDESKMDVDEQAPGAEEPAATGNGEEKAGAEEPKTNGNEDASMKDENKDETETKPKPKKPMKKVEVKITRMLYHGQTQDQSQNQATLENYKRLEEDMNRQDKECHETLEKKNALEEYVYSMRSKVSDQLHNYIIEKEREQFSKKLNDAEDWLYGDGEDQKMDVYITRLNQLQEEGNRFESRYHEDVNRSEKVGMLNSRISECRAFANTKQEQYSHILPAQWLELTSKCDEAEKWLSERMAEQRKLSKTQDPVLYSAEIDKKLGTLDMIVGNIERTPKPAPKKETKPESKPKEEAKPEAPAPGDADNGKGDDAEMQDAENPADKMDQTD